MVHGIRALAAQGTKGALGVRENAAGRRNERKGRSTPRMIRDPGRAKGWSPAAFERGSGSGPRTGTAREPMDDPVDDPVAAPVRRAQRSRQRAEVWDDVADRAPARHRGWQREFFRPAGWVGRDAGRGARAEDRHGRGRGRVRRRKSGRDRRGQETKSVPATPCGAADGGDPAWCSPPGPWRSTTRFAGEVGIAAASGTRSGRRRRRTWMETWRR